MVIMHRSAGWTATSYLGAFIGGLLLFIGGLLLWCVVVRDFKGAKNDLIQRHLEATNAIEQIYAYNSLHGQWPTDDEFEKQGRFGLPAGWNYFFDSGSPLIMLDGEYHMSIVYRFLPPVENKASATWVHGFEGDKSEFQADVTYHVTEPSRLPK